MTSQRKMPTRKMVVQNLGQGVPFSPNQEGFTPQEFKDHAAAFAKKNGSQFEALSGEERLFAMEKHFWVNLIGRQQGEPLEVEYAADLPVNSFGSGFPNSLYCPEGGEPYLRHPWKFSNLITQPGSLLQFAHNKSLSGITEPWLYFGMLWSSFCWHYEDIMLPSINYMHAGGSKVWYAIPGADRKKFEKASKEKLAALHENDPNFLLDITVQVSPAYLTNRGVTVYRTE